MPTREAPAKELLHLLPFPAAHGVARKAVVVSANGKPTQQLYDCDCCPPGGQFLFKLPNTRFNSLSTRSASSSSLRVLASVVPSEVPSVAEELVDYLNASWTSFHATAESARMLTQAGFTRLSERDEWDLKPGGKYFFTRNMSSIVAFAVGEKYEPGNGFNIIGARTDSPCPKLKPVSAVTKGGFLGVGADLRRRLVAHLVRPRPLRRRPRVAASRQGQG